MTNRKQPYGTFAFMMFFMATLLSLLISISGTDYLIAVLGETAPYAVHISIGIYIIAGIIFYALWRDE